MDVSVVIVNYNVRDFLDQTIRSVEQAVGNLDVEIFVVDNNSVDGSVSWVRTHFPDVHLIENRTNVGFGAANNQAIRQASGRFLFILNPDTRIQEDTLQALVSFLEKNPDAGAVGCKILDPDGAFSLSSRRSFPTPSAALYRMLGLSRVFPKSRVFGQYNMTWLSEDKITEVDALSGSCMMVRTEAIKQNFPPPEEEDLVATGPSDREKGAGIFDERFFMYGEDLDWCFRIQQAGWKIYYTPETQIIHYKGESTKKGELRYVRLFYGAMIIFLEKHFPSRYPNWFMGLMKGAVAVRAGLSAFAQFLRSVRPMALDFGIIWGSLFFAARIRALIAGNDFFWYYLAVAPLFAAITVLSIRLAGGYPRDQTVASRYAFRGVVGGFILAATASFFFKEIGYSRIAMAAGFFIASVGCLFWRHRTMKLHTEPRRAAIVGDANESARLLEMLMQQPTPGCVLTGWISSGPDNRNAAQRISSKLLGSPDQIREIVRYYKVEDLIFAESSASSIQIIEWMRQLRDLPVRFLILPEGKSHLIGQSLIRKLGGAAVRGVEPVPEKTRTRFARRVFELAAASVMWFLHPFFLAGAKLGSKRMQRFISFSAQAGSVFSGSQRLVGLSGDVPLHQAEPALLGKGLFSIYEYAHMRTMNADEIYLYYLQQESARLDLEIIFRLLMSQEADIHAERVEKP